MSSQNTEILPSPISVTCIQPITTKRTTKMDGEQNRTSSLRINTGLQGWKWIIEFYFKTCSWSRNQSIY